MNGFDCAISHGVWASASLSDCGYECDFGVVVVGYSRDVSNVSDFVDGNCVIGIASVSVGFLVAAI